MSSNDNGLAEALQTIVAREIDGATGIDGLRRLSGGASQETWAFDTVLDGHTLPLVLRRARATTPGDGDGPGKLPLETEAKVIRLARNATPLAPNVRYVATPADGIGHAYIMDRVEGETISRRILRDDAYAEARPKLARQCGEAIAMVHTVPTDSLSELRCLPAREQLEDYRATYDRYDYPHPVYELAFQWLEDRLVDTPQITLVHGDFRNGNIVVDRDGLAAVLDWELVHLGDPMEDLGWMCVHSWRYGAIDKPVGGFGDYDDLFAGYEAAGGTVDPERVRFWEAFGSLKWGIMCMTMYDIYRRGIDRSVERAAIGRRCSETEIDLLTMMERS